MADYFVSVARGSDSTGTGTATNPWASIGKAIGPTPAITLSGSGTDRVFVEPGIYRETIAVGLSPSSGNPLEVVGDGTGAGFLAGGYSTPATGDVEIVAWTDDVTPFTTTAVPLAISNKSYVTVRGFKVTGGGGANTYGCFDINGGSANITLERCIFENPLRNINGRIETATATALNVTVRQCHFESVVNASTFYGVDVRSPVNATEYGLGVLFENCEFFGSAGAIKFTQFGGTGTAWSTGTTVQQCDFRYCYRGVWVSSPTALTTPIAVNGCTFEYGNSGVVATTAGQLSEDGNGFVAPTPVTNVTGGVHSLTSFRPMRSLHDERLYDGPLRRCFEPKPGSKLLGAGNYGTPPTVDLWNRRRPEGGGSLSPAIGSMERHDTATLQASVVQAGTAAYQIAGPGSHEWLVPVAATATTLSVYTQADANYGTTNPPVFEMDAEPQYGVSSATATAASTTGAWNQVSIGPFTPTSKGWVRVRVKATPAAANGICYVDTFDGATGDPAAMDATFRGGVPKALASTTTTTIINVFNSEC